MIVTTILEELGPGSPARRWDLTQPARQGKHFVVADDGTMGFLFKKRESAEAFIAEMASLADGIEQFKPLASIDRAEKAQSAFIKRAR